MNWYKIANEYSSYADSAMTPQNLADVQVPVNIPNDFQGGMGGASLTGLGITNMADTFGKKVIKCGDEPGSNGGCGVLLEEYGKWHNYSITINGEKYRAYKCQNCHHSLQPFNIQYTKRPKRKSRNKKRVKNLRRLGNCLTLRNYTEAQIYSKPGGTGGSPQGNPANAPFGRSDYTDNQRAIPWSEVDKDFDQAYDQYVQKNRTKDKIIKIKDKDGKDKFVKVKYLDGIEGSMPANTTRIKGDFSKQHRYNPEEGKNGEGRGAWPHNRDWGKGGYGINTPQNMDSDWRSRVMLWTDYIKDRSTNLLTLTKPL